jgi:NAD(P)-dependent dehydrogenase (short-subunit alcohol dehydrogenase family)
LSEAAGAGNRFQGRVAVITGASRGIGLAIATRIVGEGGQVVITARNPEPLAEAVAGLGGPDHAIAVAGKADDLEHQAETLAAAVATFGRIDILINNTGINPTYGTLLEFDPAAGRKIMEVNVLGALSWVRQARAAGLGVERPGAIVNVASITGLHPSPGIAFYGVSKAALIGLTQQLAYELAPSVRVNAVAPAVIKTKFATALYEGREDEVAAGYALGRLGVPEDVSGAVAFLASDDAAWITGQTIVIDGGITLKSAL